MLEHHKILPRKKGFVVDHRDDNGRNNDPSNLRYLTFSQNAVHRNNPLAGISKVGQKWRVRIAGRHLGYFNSESDAVAVRALAVKEWLA